MSIFFIQNFPFVWELAEKIRDPAIKAAHYGMIFANSLNDENFSTLYSGSLSVSSSI